MTGEFVRVTVFFFGCCVHPDTARWLRDRDMPRRAARKSRRTGCGSNSACARRRGCRRYHRMGNNNNNNNVSGHVLGVLARTPGLGL